MTIQSGNWSVDRQEPVPVLAEPRTLVADADRDWKFRLNSYDAAFAALVSLKQGALMAQQNWVEGDEEPIVPIDYVYDDRLISKLCQLTYAVTEELIRKHIELRLGLPTEETIDQALMELENENVIGSGTDSI
jgi:hypothetical protein